MFVFYKEESVKTPPYLICVVYQRFWGYLIAIIMIPHDNHDGQMLYTIIENIFSMFHVGKILRKANAGKNRKDVFIIDDTLLAGLMAITYLAPIFMLEV